MKMRLFEYVDTYSKSGKTLKIDGQVKRIRSKYLFRFGKIAILLGILLVVNGAAWKDVPNATKEQLVIGDRFIMGGCSLIFTIAPCLFIYPIVRGLSLSQKDSWLNVVITFITEEWLKHKLTSYTRKKDKKF